MFGILIAAVAIVPAPREQVWRGGTCMFAEKDIRVTRDAALPPEGYWIDATTGGVTVASADDAGVFYAMKTLRQMAWDGGRDEACPSQGGTVASTRPVVAIPCCRITDSPAFRWRGLMLDEGRHFFGKETVKDLLDRMADYKLNVFHWHLTEDQGWRIEIKQYPRLTEVGAWRSGTTVGKNSGIDDGVRHGGFYTQDECREIVKYAADRYITVIPEIDMPGHMLAALASYPELGCTGGPYEVSHLWGVFPDVLCMGKEDTFKFIEGVLDEVISIFPSEYIHIGGDECPRTRWAECPLCQKRIEEEGLVAQEGRSKEDLLQGYFTRRVEKYLHEKGKKLIGWDELLNCNVDQTSTIMSWRGAEPGAKAAKLGHDVIMSPNKPMYFDHYQTADISHEPLSIGGNETVKDVYSFEPVAADLSADEAKHIMGVQANLWTEYVAYPHHIEYQVLPRMAALAEVQWLQPARKDYDNFLVRLKRLKEIYDLHHWTVAQHVFK